MFTPAWRACRAVLRAAVVFAAVISAASAFAQSNLLQNGSFESSFFNDTTASAAGIGYVSSPPNGSSGRATVPNWTWTAGSSSPSTFALNVTGGGLGVPAQAGDYSVSFGTGSAASGGAISQVFNVTNGARCTLTFFVRRIGAGQGISAKVTVTDATTGSPVALVDTAGTTHSTSYGVPMPTATGVWTEVKLVFTANSSSMRFTFTDTTPGSVADSTDLGLDNVSITQKTLQTLTFLGGVGSQGQIAANTEYSRDGVNWYPAYLSGNHPWGNLPGTTSWINRDPSPFVGLNETTDFRIRFTLPADFEGGSMTFRVNADNIGEMIINGSVLATTYGGYSPSQYTVGGSSLLPGQINTLNVRLTDQGGWVGINYVLTLTGYASSAPEIVVLPPVITSGANATGTVGQPFSFTVTAGNNPTGFASSALPSGLSLNSTTGVISGTPTTVGAYPVTLSVSNSGGATQSTLTITINKGAATVQLGSLSHIYDGTVKSATATTNPANLGVAFSYSPDGRINAGTYNVLAAVANPNYTGSATGVLTIAKAPVTITLSNLTQAYTGSPRVVSVSSHPANVPVSVTYNGAPTAPAAVGSYAVVATSASPNYSGSASGTLVIKDVTPPMIAVPASQTLEATSAAGAVATFSANATDDVDGAVSVLASPASGSVFPLGTTTVNLLAKDAAGNQATGSFSITVQDTTGPVLSLPANQTLEATGAAGAVATFAATATDAVTASPVIAYSVSSGSTFALGVNTVTVTATDAAGNASTGSFTVTVVDTTAPVIAAQGNLVLEATGATGAVASFAPSAADLVDGTVAVTSAPASGSTFPLGTSTVTLTATDAAGNSSNSTFTVTVVDTTPAVISGPGNLVAEAASSAGAVVTFASSALDSVDGSVAVSAVPASGSTFPLGTTTVTLNAVDAAGNTSSTSFAITVADTTAPVLTVPANQVVEAASGAGAVASYTASATDAVSATSVSYSVAPGSTFALGTTTVVVTARDAAGNSSTGSFTVTVADTTKPVLSVPANQVLEATSAAGAVATYAASATDAVSVPGITYSVAPGSTFAIGTTTVMVTATDAAGNATSGTFTVTVRDTTAPAIGTVSATPNTIWPPNKKMVPVVITAPVTDAVGATAKIVSVTTNEPDGTTQWEVTGNLTLNVKSDRKGGGSGRVYTITVEAKDAAGNATRRTVTVTVPHDQRK